MLIKDTENHIGSEGVLTFLVLSFKLGPKAHLAGQSFTLADVTVFPTIATLFRFGSVAGTK